jgi:hypothetical protein
MLAKSVFLYFASKKFANLGKVGDGMTKIERSKRQNQQRTSEQTRNKAEEENQIQDLARDFKVQEQWQAWQMMPPPLITKAYTTDHCRSCITC